MNDNLLHILLVEDNSTDVLLLEEALAEVGSSEFALTRVKRLDEARALLHHKYLDVVLLDLGLPDSQGLETFAQMQREHPTVPILILSGLDNEALAVRAVQDGAQDFLVKGKINSSTLSRTIRYAIERKRIEQRLIASETGYRRLFETTQDGIIILDADTGQITDANPFLENLLGFTRIEFIGKRLWEIPPFRHKAASQAAFRTLQEQGFIRYEALPLMTKDGRQVDVEFASNVYEAGSQQVIQCNIRDITERKRAEAAEQELQRFQQSTLDALSSRIAVLDENGKIIAINNVWRQFSEANQGTVESCGVGANYTEVCDQATGTWAEEASALAQGMRQVMEGQHEAFCLEYPCHSPSEERWFNVCVTRFVGEGPVRVVVAHENITERKKAEATLGQSEARFRMAITAAPLPIIIHREDGQVLQLSQGWTQYSGYDINDIPTIHDWANRAYGKNSAQVQEYIDELYQIKETREEGEWRITAKSGEERIWDFRSTPLGTFGDNKHVIISAALDVTERKQAEQKLRESELRFQSIVANTPGTVYQFVCQPDGSVEIPFVNDGCRGLFEMEPEELQRNPTFPSEMIHPDDRAHQERSVLKSAQTLEPWSCEWRIRLPSGVTKWVQGAGRPRRLPNGGTLWDGLLMDITARKVAEEERDRFFTLSLDMIAIIGSDGYMKRLNPAFETALGFSNAEMKAVPFLEFVHPDDHAATLEGAAKLQSGANVTEFQNRYRCRDGSYKWLRWTCAPFEELWYCVAHDVTDDKRAEAALVESEERFRQMAESVDEVFWLFDPLQEKLLYISPAYERTWGRSCQSLLDQSMSFMDTVHPEDRSRILAALEHQGEPGGYSEEHRIVRPNGAVRWVWARTFPIYNERGEVYRIAGIAQDIGARKQAEAALHKANDELELRVEERTAELQKANAETRTRARQQEAVAELGHRALMDIELDTLLTGATALVTATLDVEISSVLELMPGGDTLSIRASTGWKTDMNGTVVLGHARSTAGYALMAGAPIIVPDLRTETRFEVSPLLLDEGIVSGVTVIVGSHERPFGTLGAHTVQQRHFTRDDVHFLQSIANVLAAALERRNVEETLYKNHEFLQAVLENTAEGIVACDAEGQLTFFNRATRDFHGLPIEPLPADQWSHHYSLYAPDGITPMPPEDVPLFQALSGEHVRNMEMVIVPRQGSPRLLIANGEPLFDADGAKLGAVVVMHDITGPKQAESEISQLNVQLKETNEKLRLENIDRQMALGALRETTEVLVQAKQEAEQARKNADDANLAKSEFLSRMSHELRTPLNAILGFGQILDKQVLAPLARESVGYILKGGRHLLDLINEVLDIARVEAGHLELSLEPIALDDMVPEACALVRPLASRRSIHLHESVLEPGCHHILADRQRLKQVLLNLLSNAIKYNREGGQVEVSCDQGSNGWTSIAVRDTGPGISAQDLPKLFMPFERLGAAASEVEGSGLGLVLSQRMVTAMGGTLSVESTLGQGTTFTIQLPQTTSLTNWSGDVSKGLGRPDTKQEVGRSHCVLCIEDNPSNLHLMEAIFELRPQITLLTAVQGSIGLDMACQHEPDLILLDLNLPDIHGKEVMARLQRSALTRDIPIIVVSADATPGQVNQLLAAGARDYLTKPLDVDLFLHTLDRFLPVTPTDPGK